MKCIHPNAVVVHRMKSEVVNGKQMLIRRPNHVWCTDCRTSIDIVSDRAPVGAP